MRTIKSLSWTLLLLFGCSFERIEVAQGPGPEAAPVPAVVGDIPFDAPVADAPEDPRRTHSRIDPPTLETPPTIDSTTPTGASSSCGDGIIRGAENCDDGNTIDGDGCDSNCAIEHGFNCILDLPSVCFGLEETVHVDPRACVAPGTGAESDPFCSIAQAVSLGAPRTILLAPETFEERVQLDGGDWKLLAPTGALVTTDSHEALKIKGGANVVVRGLTISGSLPDGGGVVVEGDGTSALFADVHIGPSAETGISIKRGASFELDRGSVVENQRGGIRVDSEESLFITNSVIAHNGGPDAPLGGVQILRSPQTLVFLQNTIALNISKSDVVAGVHCAVEGVSIVDSIIWANAGLDPLQSPTACEPIYSNLSAPIPGEGNFATPPSFIDVDFRVDETCACRGRGRPDGPSTPWDRDGRLRNTRRPADVGAYRITHPVTP